MINLRSSLSALALVGAFVGFSTAAHAAPMLSVIDDGTLFSGTDNGVTVDVADFNKSGKVKTQYLVQLDAGLSGNGNPVTFNTASIANTPFAAAVTFTLSGNEVKFSNYGVTAGKFSNLSYTLVSGVADNSNYSTLAVKSPVTPGSDPLTWSGLTNNASYSLLIQGTAVSGPGTVTGELSAVPLPGSLVMFGSALLGLTAFGARRRSSIKA